MGLNVGHLFDVPALVIRCFVLLCSNDILLFLTEGTVHTCVRVSIAHAKIHFTKNLCEVQLFLKVGVVHGYAKHTTKSGYQHR